ncbi:MAG TPA: O-antigen ligase family protein [Solirubrobacterales bacterium]
MTESDSLRRAIPFLPAAIVIAGWVVWAHFDGAYFPNAWYPSALAALGLLAVTVLGTGRIVPVSRPAQAALAAFAALVAWNFASLAWSTSPGAGWESSNKLLLYLALLWTVSLLPWTPSSARIALGLWVAGVVAVCAVSLLSATTGSLADYFIEGRYLDPIGYSNGVSALPAMAFFPALWLCSRRDAGIAERVCFLAAAVFLIEFALLPQSRAAVIGFAAGILVFVCVFPRRLRLIPPLLVVAGAVALSIGTIYDVYTVGIDLAEATEAGRVPVGLDLGAALDDAVRITFFAAFGAAVLGMIWAAVEGTASPGERSMRRVRVGVGGTIAAVLVVALALAAVNAGSIADGIGDRWQTFKSSEDVPRTDGARLISSESDQRYDYWRVAVDQFRRTPVAGAGAGSYEAIYSAERHFDKPSKYTHDIWLRALAEGGLVAFALLLAYLAAIATGLVVAWRRLDELGRGMIAACAAISVYFFVHASFDWLEEFPALAAPALALPLIGIVAAGGSAALPRVGRGARYAIAAVLGTLFVAAFASLVFPYLSQRHLDRGAEIGLGNVVAAREELGRAAALNPLSPEPRLRAGTILVAGHRPGAAAEEFRRALEVEDHWYAHFELALLYAQAGRHRAALQEIAQARTLDRHDPFVAEALFKIRRGRPIDAAAFNMRIQQFEAQRFTRPGR